MQRVLILAAFFALWTLSSVAEAQNPDPRDYEVGYFVPNHTTVINTYLRHQSSNVGRDIDATGLAFRATHILKFKDLVITPFDFILPVQNITANQSLSALSPAFQTVPSDFKLSLHATGLGDVTFLPSIGWGMQQNAQNHTHTWFAATFYITAPTGVYKPERFLNVGQNRWTLQPLVTVGQRFWRVVTLEALGSAAFYTDNDEFRVLTNAQLRDRNLTLKQKASYNAAAHLAVDLAPSFWVGTSYYLAVNGKRTTEVPTGDTVQVDDRYTIHTFRLNFGIRITPQTALLAQWNQDLAGSEGATIGRFFGLRFSHAFFKAPPAAPPSREPTAPAKPSGVPAQER